MSVFLRYVNPDYMRPEISRIAQILFTAGAAVSRYLVQLAVRHYHHAQVSFIRKPWVRTLSFAVFAQFLVIAASRFDEDLAISRTREEHDGEVFLSWVAERDRNTGGQREKEKRLIVAHVLRQWKVRGG